MFERVRRLFRAESADEYINDVAAALLREGLQPAELDRILATPGFQTSGRILLELRAMKLTPQDAGQALALAIKLFQKTERMAAKRGWPLKSGNGGPNGVPRSEAYFLELLNEAVASVRFVDGGEQGPGLRV